MRRFATLVAAWLSLHAAGTSATAQIMPGQVDDFEQGGTQGWGEGGSPNPPQVMSSGGPDGDGDAFLQNRSSGITGPGGRMIVFNTASRWRGNYLDAEITALEVDLNNLGTTPLSMRFDLVRSAPNPQANSDHVFTQAFQVQPGSGWQHATFSLDPGVLFSSGNITNILSNVVQLRLIHEPGGSPSHPPTPVNGLLGIDNIRAVGPPIMEDLPGDYNGSGLVEQADLDLVLVNWGSPASPPPMGWISDLPDATIDQAELDGVLVNWGNSSAGATVSLVPLGAGPFGPVPEPESVWLLTVAGLLALGVRRSVGRRVKAAFP